MSKITLTLLFFYSFFSTPSPDIELIDKKIETTTLMESDVMITEIMYDPDSSESSWEWIEIYNKGTESIDLTGYVLDDNNTTKQSSANIVGGTIAPKSTAILFDSDITVAHFTEVWGTVNAIPVNGWPGLNNSGDTIGIWAEFEKYEGDNETQLNVIEQVAYEDGNDWPDDNNGSSIYLKSLEADNNSGTNWALSAVTTETPLGTAIKSKMLHSNSGNDIGSPNPVAIVDTISPVITCSENIEISNDENSCSATITLTQPTATDNVSTQFSFKAVRSDGLTIEDSFSVGETKITWTATDEANNSSEPCEQLVKVLDNEAPTAIGENMTIELDENGQITIDPEDLDHFENPSFDNCEIEEYRASKTSFDCTDLNTTTKVAFSVVDESGNESEITTVEVTVVDKLKPVLTCGVNIVTISSGGDAIILEEIVEPLVSDNCDEEPTLTYERSDEKELNAPFEVGTTTITWQAVDASGNIETCNQTIVVDFEQATANSILAFSIEGQLGDSIIDEETNSITVLMPNGTDISDLTPIFEISDHAESSPLSGVAANFTETQNYVVTAQNGTKKEWTVKVNVAEDTTAPTFQVKGNSENFETVLEVGDTYVVGEITDIVDENETNSEILGDAAVDTSQEGGPFLVTYKVSDGINTTTIIETVLVNASETPKVEILNFTLVNADTHEDLFVLEEGMKIPLENLPTTNLNIRANTTEIVNSVSFTLSGKKSTSRTENVVPFALYGDAPAGIYKGSEFELGEYVISATPFAEKQEAGEAGEALALNFEFIKEQRPFITTWKTDNPGDSDDNQITIEIEEIFNPNFNIDWGDGTSNSDVTSTITHTYTTSGIYEVKMTGEFLFWFNTEKLIAINQWGSENLGLFPSFSGCVNMDVLATDIPNLENVVSLENMFNGCTNLVGNTSFGDWDVSDVTEFDGMFFGASSFNQDISSWDVSNGIDFEDMFNNASSFNQDISSWDVSKALNLQFMFNNASSFNQDISSWDVSSVEDMFGMFSGAQKFDQNLGDWQIQNVLNMSGMFYDAGLSTENYDKLLHAWAGQQLQKDVNFTAAPSQYCSGERARQKIIDEFGWKITDGGKAEDCNSCQTSQVVLNTQQQVDDFAVTYDLSTCTFENGILIEGTDIENLVGLSDLTYIGGSLYIRNTALTHLDGLSALNNLNSELEIVDNLVLKNIDGLSNIANNELPGSTGIGTILISGNAALTNINGLKFLTIVYSDIVIKNNKSLTSLDGLSSLKHISDSFIIENNAALSNVDGISSLVFLDNDLIIKSNPLLTNLDGFSSLDNVGLSLIIQSNSALSNIDGLSAMSTFYGDLEIAGNNQLTNLNGLTNLEYVGGKINIIKNNKLTSLNELSNLRYAGDLNIIENITLSDCAIDAVCNSQIIVGDSLLIFGNIGKCASNEVALEACNEEIESEATLVEATYLEGIKNPEPKGPILRAEEGNRETYLKFNISEFAGTLTAARLEMLVTSDPGHGTVEVFLGSHSNWTETTLNSDNKPSIVGSALASINGTHALGQTKIWNLAVENLPSDGEVTLIVKHSNGNDVAFASDETSQAPKLVITSRLAPVEQYPFITTWKTDNPGFSEDNQIIISTAQDEIYNYNIDWGDGTSDEEVTHGIKHTYETPGTYTVTISGAYPKIVVFSEEREKIIEVNQWGTTEWTSMKSAFEGCINLDVTAEDVPNLSKVKNAQFMFSSCQSLVGNATFNQWNTSNIEDMSFMFGDAAKFNQPLGNWDTSKVINMEEMFARSLFNSDISKWNTANVTIMVEMFEQSFFNQDISKWNVSKVKYMGEMFQNTPFNQDISAWDVSSVEDMFGMFSGAQKFDQNLGDWQIQNVLNMSGMFYDAGLSTENYDRLLHAWAGQQLQKDVNFTAAPSQYCSGEAARQRLIDDFGWIIEDGGKAEDCTIPIENEANLVDATYLHDNENLEPTGPILRTEQGIRQTYIKFNTSEFTNALVAARLEMVVASDPGHGTIEVFLGSHSNWTETDLDSDNKPTIVGSALASINGTHALGQTKIWNLEVSELVLGGEITLILKHSNGNDVAFASDESNQPPRLFLTTTGSGLSSKNSNTLSVFPNPATTETSLSFKEPTKLVKVYLYDVLGRVMAEYEAATLNNVASQILNLQTVPTGTYYLKAYDTSGHVYQKLLIVK